MYEVDARGLSCPEPVMLTHEALKNHGGEPKKVSITEMGDGFELVIE